MDIEKILAGRRVVDAYREAHTRLYIKQGTSEEYTPLLEEMFSSLRALGFNFIEEFMEANKQAVLEDFNRSTRFEGECDFCEGRKKGCLQDCYDSRTLVDETTPTGRSPLVAGSEGNKGINSAMSYWSDYYRTLPPRKKGRITPIVPNCSIMLHIIENPALDWTWE